MIELLCCSSIKWLKDSKFRCLGKSEWKSLVVALNDLFKPSEVEVFVHRIGRKRERENMLTSFDFNIFSRKEYKVFPLKICQIHLK